MKKTSDRTLLEQQDEELISMVQKGSIVAIEKLYESYKGLIYTVSITFLKENGLAQMYFDDLIDIATDTLLRCSQKYTIGNDNSFLNYWWGVTKNQFGSFLRKTVSTGIVYFDPNLVETSEICLFDSSHSTPTKGVEFTIEQIIKNNSDVFTLDERVFIEYFIQGLKPLEISELLSWNRSKMYRIKRSAMNKLNKIIKSN